MRDTELKTKFKLSPTTFNKLRKKFTGETQNVCGRLEYSLTAVDKMLLRVGRLDPNTFRDNFYLLMPFHKLLVYLTILYSKEEVLQILKTMNLVSSKKLLSLVDHYRGYVVACLPEELGSLICKDKPIPVKYECWLRAILEVLDIGYIFDKPDVLDSFDEIVSNELLHLTTEVVLTLKGDNAQKLIVVNNLAMTDVKLEVFSQYNDIVYNASFMTSTHWSKYLNQLTMKHNEHKQSVLGLELTTWVDNNHLSNILLTDVQETLKDALHSCHKDIEASSIMSIDDRAKLRDTTVKTILLIREVLGATSLSDGRDEALSTAIKKQQASVDSFEIGDIKLPSTVSLTKEGFDIV